MLNSVKNDMLKNSEHSISKPLKDKDNPVVLKSKESYHSSIVEITPKNVTDEQKESIFWGHFDFNLSKSLESDNFSSASSISMSVDLFSYSKNGLSEDKKQKLSNIFEGEDFNELKDSFFSLNGSDKSLDDFGREVDDLFSNISEALDMDEELFDGSKKLFKFTALMFSSGLQNDTQKEKQEDSDDIGKNLMTDTLATTAKLYGMMGDTDKMQEKISDAMSLQPSATIREYLDNISTKYSVYDTKHMDDLYSTLNRLSKLSSKFNKYLN